MILITSSSYVTSYLLARLPDTPCKGRCKELFSAQPSLFHIRRCHVSKCSSLSLEKIISFNAVPSDFEYHP